MRQRDMISINKFNIFFKKKGKLKNTNEKMVKIIDKLIQHNPEEYETLDDVRIDLVEGIPLSSLKKECLKKAIVKFKETSTTKTHDGKFENYDLIDTAKIEDCKVFVYNIKNAVEILSNELENLKNKNDYEPRSLIRKKSKLESECKVVLSKILQVQTELEEHVETIKKIQTKLATIDEHMQTNKS